MTNPKDQLSPTWPTIFELASSIPMMDLTRAAKPGGGRKNAPPATQGLIPQEFPAREGYFEVTPEQIASLRVPKIEVSADVKGFQREKVNAHARKIARAILAGEEMPPLIISIFPDDKTYVDDGQHRALGAVLARKPLEVVVKRRSVEQARKLFASQGKAKAVRRDDTLLTGDSAIELYIQDALTTDTHAWSHLVAQTASSYRMSPTTMAMVVGQFVFNTMNNGINYFTTRDSNDFDSRLADKMAYLIDSFGTKNTNRMAFRATTLRAISKSAVYIFRRNPALKKNDWERWRTHMANFDFSKYPQMVNNEGQLALAMVEHWNKRLPEARRVKPYTFS